jgi:FKBP-type peptidyl-prolyl cis-trans isomerase FkpA
MSAVTAVPLRPLARGSVLKLWIVLALLVAAAAGLAWWGTRWMQVVTLDSGVRVQTLRQGHGPVMASPDVIAMRFQIHRNSADGPVLSDSGPEPFAGTVQDLPAGFAEGVQHVQQGGRYLISVPVRVIMAGQPVPPTARFAADDTLVFETIVLQVDPGEASAFQMRRLQRMMQQQQMMQQGGGPPGGAPQGGPGSPPPPAEAPAAAGGR